MKEVYSLKPHELQWVMKQDHLRKQFDPKFRKEKQKEQENQRVSQWFDRYCQQANHYLKTEEQQKKYLQLKKELQRFHRTKDEYVEKQFNFLYQTIEKLLQNEDRPHALQLKNQIMRTLSVPHQELKRKLNMLK